MQSYISKPVTPVKIQALQYVPPTVDSPGNVDEVAELAPVRKQIPWDVEAGQTCVHVDLGYAEALLIPGAYLVKHADGSLEVIEPEDFHESYDRVSDAPIVTDPKNDKN